MFAARNGLRSTRAVRFNAPLRTALRRNVRFASDNAGSASAGAGGGLGPAAIGGIAGGAGAFLFGYIWYATSGAKTAVNAMHQTKSYYDGITNSVKAKFQEQTPEANEALETLKKTALGYAAFIPGGKHYVNKVFEDLDLVRQKHGNEVDNIIREAYGELRDVSKKGGINLQTANDAWEIMSKHVQNLADLAVDAGQDILGNHPELKQKFGGQFEQLQQLSQSLGPEAKKQVDETWQQVRDITKQGLQWDTLEKIRKLVQDKTQQLREMSDQAWKKGMDQVMPMLDKKPELKQMVEQNMDALKGSNISEAVQKVKSAVESGSTQNLEKYIQTAKDKAQQSSSGGGSGLSGWLDMIPGGSAIFPQLQKLKEAAEKKGPEAEKVAKETLAELREVLEKRAKQVEDMVKDAKN